ncbi:MAG: ATP-binding protein [Oscillospiraceae bacterium]|jgi:D-serine deaminase-like pyridoxal phosphate-dependent protein|nr:ATP-binding protein [Oscillospiraceae bacterium]
MRDLSLHILDLAQNSVRAGASLVEISLLADPDADRLTVTLRDDGCGMPPDLLARVTSPFTTTRTTRGIGLGIPLFQENAELAGGGVRIVSEVGRGTTVTGDFGLRHVDRPPLGDIAGTVITLVVTTPLTPDYVLCLATGERRYTFDTREMRAALVTVGLDAPEVVAWMRESLREGIAEALPGLAAEVDVTRL